MYFGTLCNYLVSRMIVAARGTMEGATTCTLLVNPTPSRPNTQQVWIPFWRPGQRYRPVFLHVNFQDLAIDAEVLEKDGSEGKLAPFSMLCALKLGSLGSSRKQFGMLEVVFCTFAQKALNVFLAEISGKASVSLLPSAAKFKLQLKMW